MKIHLLRHADAENCVTTDAARNLSETGYSQAERVGDFLVRSREPLDIILTSPYLRALQTARSVAQKFANVPLIEDARLGCGVTPQTGLAILQEYRKFENVLIVGHQPDLSFLTAYLLTLDGSLNIEFYKASLLTISLLRLNPAAGLLESYINVRQM